MIKNFVNIWDAHNDELRAVFAAKHPGRYFDVVHAVVHLLNKHSDPYAYDCPDPQRIHEIDDGHYQGTLVFVIAQSGYQPSTYWYVRVGYGSCSGCDTLQAISNYSDDTPTEDQVDHYMTLALHILQQLKQMDDKE